MSVLHETPILAKNKSVHAIIDIKKLLATVSVKYLFVAFVITFWYALCDVWRLKRLLRKLLTVESTTGLVW